MNLTDVFLSLPVVKYNTDVIHFAPRKSTQIEWLILEVLTKLKNNSNSEYNDYSVDLLFSYIFKIPDSDNLIKPCLIDLISMGAIEEHGGLSDETKMKDYVMRDLSITDIGLEMQQKGLLPGEDLTQVVEFYFNVSKKQVQIDNGKRSYGVEPIGIQIGEDLENLEKTPMPEILMREYLYQLKNQKNNCPDWLKQETEIKSIGLSINHEEPRVYWNNRKISLQLKNNMQLYVQNYDGGSQIVNQVIQYLCHDVNPNLVKQDLKVISVPNIDEFASSISTSSDIKNVFKRKLSNSNIFYFNETVFHISDEELDEILANKICIVFSTSEFSIREDNGMIIKVPIDSVSISKDCAFGTNKESEYLGLFTISGDSYSEKLPLYFSKENLKENLNIIINQILSSYLNDRNIDLIYLLAANNQRDDFVKNLNQLLDGKTTLREKFSLIDHVEKKTTPYNLNLDKNNLYLSQIKMNKDKISPKEIVSVLSEIKDIYIFKKNNDLFIKAISKLLDSIPTCNTYDEINEIISQLKTNNSISNWLSSSSVVKKLYSDNVLLNLIDKYESPEFLKLSMLTRFEQCLINMKRNQISLEKLIKKGPFLIDLSRDTFQNYLVLSRIDLAPIYECMKKHWDYKKSIEVFLEERAATYENTLIRTYSDLCSDVNRYFSKIQETLNIISDVVTKFYDESALNYEKIYVVDTCSIMNHPELLNKFTNNKSAFILPKVVIEELNKNKDFTRDIEKSTKAKQAIAALTKYQQNNVEWLLTESSHPEYLPPEYPSVIDRNNQEWQITDNLILSIALKYKVRNVILITDDKNLWQKAISENVICTNTNKFLGINTNKGGKK